MSAIEKVLLHYGIKGMKWGVRKDRGGSSGGSSSSGVRSIKDLGDDEIRTLINRIQMEKQLTQLLAESAPTKKKRAVFAKKLVGDVGKKQVTRIAFSGADLLVEGALKKSNSKDLAKLADELARVRTKKK